MPFAKSFPKKSEKSVYPKWEEVQLSEEEEKNADLNAREENIEFMKQSVDDAKRIFGEKDLKRYQTDMVRLAISLFEKRASHSVYHKERMAKEKFNSVNSS